MALTHSNLNLRDGLILFVGGDAGSDAAADLQLPRALDLQAGVEGHLEFALGILQPIKKNGIKSVKVCRYLGTVRYGTEP